ncbi:MAG: histidine--tRNA ligase [Clostridia bacterium]|nr:histidine--tRNA ligase [Clostridia bacterium]
MSLLTQAPKGTQDILPGQSEKWQCIENVLRDEAALRGFSEIRTPVFEHTELFQRSVGETTDVVQKEMYTFLDKGGRSVTLRPEGTAGAIRAVLEHALYNSALPVKISYITSCYRYEKPQAGRYREFHQFGVEMIGSNEPAADAEVICLADSIFRRLGIRNLSLEINSVGCPSCRKEYSNALKEYFRGHYDELCDTCRGRLDKNPMRILDCKSPICSAIAASAPKILDYLCTDCSTHFEGVKKYLDAQGIAYKVNPSIVRGLDYYTNTVFEFISNDLGAQSTVCGGGRYNGLCEEMSGKSLPALGFGLGLERLLLILEAQEIELPGKRPPEIYIASIGENAALAAFRLRNTLCECGVAAECDLSARGLKAQMKYADKLGAAFTLVLGDDEIAAGKGSVKNMKTGEKTEVPLDEGFPAAFAALS